MDIMFSYDVDLIRLPTHLYGIRPKDLPTLISNLDTPRPSHGPGTKKNKKGYRTYLKPISIAKRGSTCWSRGADENNLSCFLPQICLGSR